MKTFIVTVEFEHTDSVAVEVREAGWGAAADAAFAYFLGDADSDRPTGATAQTIEEFESDFGRYEPGMFVRVN